mmetsp:Transcript_16030/g.55974  ORF Transcript_16030/g.55974 Transcript_16030/m.55974 type:complete len:674 (-) Transcript_16030:875-2896(-)
MHRLLRLHWQTSSRSGRWRGGSFGRARSRLNSLIRGCVDRDELAALRYLRRRTGGRRSGLGRLLVDTGGAGAVAGCRVGNGSAAVHLPFDLLDRRGVVHVSVHTDGLSRSTVGSLRGDILRWDTHNDGVGCGTLVWFHACVVGVGSCIRRSLLDRAARAFGTAIATVASATAASATIRASTAGTTTGTSGEGICGGFSAGSRGGGIIIAGATATSIVVVVVVVLDFHGATRNARAVGRRVAVRRRRRRRRCGRAPSRARLGRRLTAARVLGCGRILCSMLLKHGLQPQPLLVVLVEVLYLALRLGWHQLHQRAPVASVLLEQLHKLALLLRRPLLQHPLLPRASLGLGTRPPLRRRHAILARLPLDRHRARVWRRRRLHHGLRVGDGVHSSRTGARTSSCAAGVVIRRHSEARHCCCIRGAGTSSSRMEWHLWVCHTLVPRFRVRCLHLLVRLVLVQRVVLHLPPLVILCRRRTPAAHETRRVRSLARAVAVRVNGTQEAATVRARRRRDRVVRPTPGGSARSVVETRRAVAESLNGRHATKGISRRHRRQLCISGLGGRRANVGVVHDRWRPRNGRERVWRWQRKCALQRRRTRRRRIRVRQRGGHTAADVLRKRVGVLAHSVILLLLVLDHFSGLVLVHAAFASRRGSVRRHLGHAVRQHRVRDVGHGVAD